MNLYEVRTQYGLSQLKAASILNIPLRTYIRYEQDDSYGSNLKREMMIRVINEKCEITESKGLLSIEQIRNECDIFDFLYNIKDENILFAKMKIHLRRKKFLF